MSEAECRELDNDLAMHTAPTLLGVKCANLISVMRNEETIDEYLRKFAENTAGSGLHARVLCKCRERTLIYIYQEKLLGAWLSEADVRDFLADFGYTAEMSVEEMLGVLAGRISCGSFPHEIGAFLGYPVGDIRGFIGNQGKNCLLCGYWKVYENAEKAQRTFKIYDRCRDILFDRLNSGLDLFQSITQEENI